MIQLKAAIKIKGNNIAELHNQTIFAGPAQANIPVSFMRLLCSKDKQSTNSFILTHKAADNCIHTTCHNCCQDYFTFPS